MSVATLNMPRLGETMDEGKIVGWLVEPGQKFKRGDAILEVETDKTVVDYPALGGGTIVETLANDGDMVEVGEPIAHIDLGDGADWTIEQDAAHGVSSTNSTDVAPLPAQNQKMAQHADGERPRATPVARRLAREQGVDLNDLTGTGRRGRIEADDVAAAPNDLDGDRIQFSHDIAYVDSDPKSGIPYLLIHGFAGDHTTFAQLSNGLKRAGARVVTCDLPGHGATRLEAATPADLSTNLGEFTRAVMGQKPFHLVAHSLGAVPALVLAEKFDIASLSLIAPVGLAEHGNSEFLSRMAAPDSVSSVKDLLDLLTEAPTNLSEAAIADIFAELSRARLIDLATQLGAKQQTIVPALEKLSKNIAVRLLVAENDRIVGKANLSALAPDIAVHRFTKSGHMPHWEYPRAVLNIILAAGY